MTRQDFKGVFGHTPQSFRDQVNEALIVWKEKKT